MSMSFFLLSLVTHPLGLLLTTKALKDYYFCILYILQDQFDREKHCLMPLECFVIHFGCLRRKRLVSQRSGFLR